MQLNLLGHNAPLNCGVEFSMHSPVSPVRSRPSHSVLFLSLLNEHHAMAIWVRNQLWSREGWEHSTIALDPLSNDNCWSADILYVDTHAYTNSVQEAWICRHSSPEDMESKVLPHFCKLCFRKCSHVLLRISYGTTLSVSLPTSNWTKKFRAKMFFQ